MTKAIAIAHLMKNEENPQSTITLRLIHDADGMYRWYERGGANTEVSSHSIKGAIFSFFNAWAQWPYVDPVSLTAYGKSLKCSDSFFD